MGPNLVAGRIAAAAAQRVAARRSLSTAAKSLRSKQQNALANPSSSSSSVVSVSVAPRQVSSLNPGSASSGLVQQGSIPIFFQMQGTQHNLYKTNQFLNSPLDGGQINQKRNYHEAVIDHFNQPRNVGKLDAKKPNVGTALVGKQSCGDVIKLQIEVDEKTNKITDAKFKTFGCGSAIASSSLQTELIIGRDISYQEKLRNTDISSELNLPPVKIHCSVLQEEAITQAIEDYKTKKMGK